MDANTEIRRAVDTGKVTFGTKESEYSLKLGEGQILILSQNTPLLTIEKLTHLAALSNVPVYRFAGNGLELGSVCGKPFVISSLLVLDQGKSKASEIRNLSAAQTAAAAEEEQAKAPKKAKRARKKKVEAETDETQNEVPTEAESE
jgi:large subunit ribosomal protein L30e